MRAVGHSTDSVRTPEQHDAAHRCGPARLDAIAAAASTAYAFLWFPGSWPEFALDMLRIERLAIPRLIHVPAPLCARRSQLLGSRSGVRCGGPLKRGQHRREDLGPCARLARRRGRAPAAADVL